MLWFTSISSPFLVRRFTSSQSRIPCGFSSGSCNTRMKSRSVGTGSPLASVPAARISATVWSNGSSPLTRYPLWGCATSTSLSPVSTISHSDAKQRNMIAYLSDEIEQSGRAHSW